MNKPSSNLDDKLREMKLGYIKDLSPMKADSWWSLNDEDIAQIKQVFADEGFYPTDVFGTKMMTGQDWYGQFEKEIVINALEGQPSFLEAAKKASGLK